MLACALPAIREIVTSHEGQTVLVVSHKATIRLVLCSLLGIDERGYRDRLDQSPACLNVLDFKGPVHARLVLFNDISLHRPSAGIRAAPVQVVGGSSLAVRVSATYASDFIAARPARPKSNPLDERHSRSTPNPSALARS